MGDAEWGSKEYKIMEAKQMKVIGINGSARKDGNTAIIMNRVFAELNREGIETELIQLAGHPIRSCTACGSCGSRKNQKCMFTGDIIDECLEKILLADGLLLGSPTYFTDVTAEMKAFIDRVGFVARANDYMFKHKVGAGVIAVRRGGATHAFDTLNHFLHYMQMFLVGSTYWNMVYGRNIGEVEKDEEGMANMINLGQNMAYLLKKLNS